MFVGIWTDATLTIARIHKQDEGEQVMNVKKVKSLAKKDPNFAKKLKKLATKALHEGADSAANKEFWELFADSSDELAALSSSAAFVATGNTPYKTPITDLVKEIKPDVSTAASKSSSAKKSSASKKSAGSKKRR